MNRSQNQDGNRFSLLTASASGHDEVFVEVYVDDWFVALVSHKDKTGRKVVEFPGPGLAEEHVNRTVDLEGLREALDAAVKNLDEETDREIN